LENISRFNVVLGLFDSLAEILLANVRLWLTETNLIAISRFLQLFLRSLYSVFFSVEVVRLTAEMVEYDPVFEESEFYIREPVAFVSKSGNLFKGTDEIVGRVSDKAASVSLTWASFFNWVVDTC
jgi:hypothetical protein